MAASRFTGIDEDEKRAIYIGFLFLSILALIAAVLAVDDGASLLMDLLSYMP